MKKIWFVLFFMLVIAGLQPFGNGERVFAADVPIPANKDIFIDGTDVYQAGTRTYVSPDAPTDNLNFVGPDYEYGDQKAAVNFNLSDSLNPTNYNPNIPASISKVELKLYVPFIYIFPYDPPDPSSFNSDAIYATVKASTNTTWSEGGTFANSQSIFSNLETTSSLDHLQNILIRNRHDLSSTTGGLYDKLNCQCLVFDVTDYVKSKITAGTKDITFVLLGSQDNDYLSADINKKSYFTFYPKEYPNAALIPQLIFSGPTNAAPTDISLSNASASENQSAGTTVGTLNATDTDIGDTFTYELVTGTGDTDNASFTLASNTLKTAAVFDYENKNSYSIRVRVTDSASNTYEKQLSVSVVNVNESPTDLSLTGNSISENAAVGTTVGSLGATDPDSGESFTYTLVSGVGSTDNAKFAITGNTLQTDAALDYETSTSHSIRVSVADSGGLTFEKVLTVSVLDGNDAPTQLSLSADSVAENLPASTSVGTLSATDSNSGDTFTYSLVSGSGDEGNAGFQIVGNALQAAAIFDYETQSSYSIRVRVTDSGTPALSFEKEFTITVTDGNDVPTDVTLSGTTVNENSPVGTSVGTLGAADIDPGETFTFELVSGAGSDDNAVFQIDGSTLKTNAALDYETKSSYSIRVRVTDSASHTFEKVFAVTVIDVNEAPTDLSLSAASMAESAASGTTVGTLSSNDPDSGETLTYTLVSGTGGDDNASFTIAGNALKTATALDYETKSSYTVRVSVTDGASHAFEKAFTVSVTDVNEAPTDIGLTSLTIAENEPSGTDVGTLSAVDQDAGNTFTYSLVSGTGSTDNASFTITGNTLKTAASFDYETKSNYSIRVRVTDSGTPALSFEKQFTITVTDGNDAPTDVTLSGTTVNENSPVGTSVGTLGAADIDPGETFTFELVSGVGSDDNAVFQIDGSTLKTNAAIDYETKSSYSVRVRVTDSASHTFEKAFVVTVTDVNEAPTDLSLSAASIAESAASGTTVGTLSSNDPDTGETLTYTLVSGSGGDDNASFTIAGNTVKTTIALDYETKSSYTVRVSVTDSLSHAFEKAFTVSVTDVNEAPTDIGLTTASIGENEPSGTIVGTLSAVDQDAAETATFTFVSGLGDTDNAAFTIDGNAVKTAIPLDYETKNSYTIRIRVTDSGSLTFEKAFVITVTDGNDAPTDVALTPVSVAENAPVGTTVGTFSATDANSGDTFTYALVSGTGDTDNGKFQLTANVLTTQGVFDYENKSSYSIRVRVSDSGTPVLSFEKEFTITVTDGNDAPTDILLTHTSIGENLPIGTEVGTLSATDIDSAETFSYVLINGAGSEDNSAFTIVGSSLRTNVMFDYEQKTNYAIRVQVTDSANHMLEKSFVIDVANVNEAPSGSLAITDGEANTSSDAVVLTVNGEDPDGDALQMRFSNDSSTWSGWESLAASKAWTLSAPDGNKTVYMQLNDGTVSSDVYQASIVKDTTAPTGTIIVNNDDASTTTKYVQLTLTSSDGAGLGGVQARFSNDNTEWSTWENAPLSKPWILTDGKGDKTVYMQLKDLLGNANVSLSDEIAYKSVPMLGSSTKTGNDAQTISLTVTDFVYSNEDGTPLQTITIATLPEHGTLKLDNTIMAAGQTIASSDLGKLTYLPQDGWSGTAKLVWSAHDGIMSSSANGEISFILNAEPEPESSGGGGGGTVTDEPVLVIVNGVVQEQLATAKTETDSDGRKITTVIIDELKMNAKLEKEGNHPLVTIPFTKSTDQVKGVLNGQMVKNMEARDAVLQVATPAATYTIPAALMNIDAIREQFDTSVQLKDIQVRIEITKLAASDAAAQQQSKQNGHVSIIVPPVEFKLIGSYNGQEVEISRFNAFVERSVAIPTGIDPKKITTGVVAKKDGSFVHVPTKVLKQGSQYDAVINSLTNSMYSLIYNEKTFADVANHWSKDVVNEMGSRLVIDGVDDTHFAPDKAITRAEFTAVIVRGLGLREAHQTIAFGDVAPSDWYYTSVAIGQEYGLIQGYSPAAFAPNQPITRQEAMTIMQRALRLAGQAADPTDVQISAQLSAFKDQSDFAAWARSAAAICAQLGIVEGSNGLADPNRNITRAETAAIIKRMLVAADLIEQ